MNNNRGAVSLAIIILIFFVVGTFGLEASRIHNLEKQTEALQEVITGQNEMLSGFNPAGGITYRLRTSVATTDTTINLQSFKNRSDIPITIAVLNTDIVYGTLSPQTSRSEFISFTGVTQNSDGTAQLTGVSRGLSDIYPFAASTTLRESHPGQSIFIISDSPQLFEEYTRRRNLEHITSTWEWSSTTPPQYDQVPTNHAAGTHASTTKEFASVALVNAVTTSGAPNATEGVKGIVEFGTALESASSTILGSTGAGLTMQSRYATDTPQSSCASGYSNAGAGCSVIASLTGKIKQTWIDLTASFSFTGSTTLSSTNSATTTIDGNFGLGVNATAGNTFPMWYAVDTVGTDAYELLLTPIAPKYSTGLQIAFTPNATNTLASTLNLNGLGAKTIKTKNGQDTRTGDIRPSAIAQVIYDGTNFILQNPQISSVEIRPQAVRAGDTGSCSGSGQWSDLQLGTQVGTTSAMVLLHVFNSGGSFNYAAFRANGDTSSSTGGVSFVNNVGSNVDGQALVQTDGSGIVEWSCDSVDGGTITVEVDAFWNN